MVGLVQSLILGKMIRSKHFASVIGRGIYLENVLRKNVQLTILVIEKKTLVLWE